jgi:hypothetical protein
MATKPQSLRVTAASVLAAGLGLLAAACGSAAAPPTDAGQVATNQAGRVKLQVVESVPGGQARHCLTARENAGTFHIG